MINLKNLTRVLQFTPKVVCEVGVNEPHLCSLTDFYYSGARTILVEPLPWCVSNLKSAFPRADIHEGVIGGRTGKVRLYDRGEGAWIEDVPDGLAPDEHPGHSAIKRANFDPKFVREVSSFTFDAIDPGNIDVLCVDTEGAEWFVISRMISRPKLIRVETHFTHSGYKNPYYTEIVDRLERELGYWRLMEDVSDTLWISRPG